MSRNLFDRIHQSGIETTDGFDEYETAFRMLNQNAIDDAYRIAINLVQRAEHDDSELLHKFCDGMFEVVKLHLPAFYDFDLLCHAIRRFSQVYNLLNSLPQFHSEGYMFVGTVLESHVKIK